MPNFQDDFYMTYDLATHKYYLTFDGYEELSGEALTADHGLEYEQASRLLKRVTNIVYQFIYSWAKSVSRTEYEISLPKYRDYIRDALAEMMTALLANKTDISLFFTSETRQKFQATDIVTPQVKLILMNSGILTRAELPYIEGYEELRGEAY